MRQLHRFPRIFTTEGKGELRIVSVAGSGQDGLTEAGPRPDLPTLIMERLASGKAPQIVRLVEHLSHESGQGVDNIVAQIIRLEHEGKLSVREPKPYTSFASYLFSLYSVWFWQVVLATISSMGLVLVSSGPLLYPRYFLGGFLVFFLPGYALTNIVYSNRREIDGLTRAVLSSVLSLSTTTLVGFALNYTPFGITVASIVSSLGTLTLALALVASMRNYSNYSLASGLFSHRDKPTRASLLTR